MMPETTTPAAAPSDRARVRRLPKRGVYDRAAIDAILDEGMVCHVGFVHEGAPVVIPTGYARSGDELYVHGSVASRMLRSLAGSAEICVTVTLLDGLVLARSAFHHSMNYRSVVVFGQARVLETTDEKREALRLFTEHLIPGRWDTIRPPTDKELSATLVLALPLDEASAKTRSGPPLDDDEDYALPIWAGVLPLAVSAGVAIADPSLASGIPVPEHIATFHRS
ncbi:MAG: pyridoxamine 5'-phosphate oxidase family protein [Acidobacteriota bacterium]